MRPLVLVLLAACSGARTPRMCRLVVAGDVDAPRLAAVPGVRALTQVVAAERTIDGEKVAVRAIDPSSWHAAFPGKIDGWDAFAADPDACIADRQAVTIDGQTFRVAGKHKGPILVHAGKIAGPATTFALVRADDARALAARFETLGKITVDQTDCR